MTSFVDTIEKQYLLFSYKCDKTRIFSVLSFTNFSYRFTMNNSKNFVYLLFNYSRFHRVFFFCLGIKRLIAHHVTIQRHECCQCHVTTDRLLPSAAAAPTRYRSEFAVAEV